MFSNALHKLPHAQYDSDDRRGDNAGFHSMYFLLYRVLQVSRHNEGAIIEYSQ